MDQYAAYIWENMANLLLTLRCIIWYLVPLHMYVYIDITIVFDILSIV